MRDGVAGIGLAGEGLPYVGIAVLSSVDSYANRSER